MEVPGSGKVQPGDGGKMGERSQRRIKKNKICMKLTYCGL